MLPWWGWVLLWVVLLVASGLWLFVLSRRGQAIIAEGGLLPLLPAP